jgi:hypothetical protein
MTVEQDLFDTLKVLGAGTRVFPDVAPYGTARPYITYQQVGGEPVSFLENTLPSKKNSRFQINCWATTRLAAAALARQVEAAMVQASAFQARPLADHTATHNEDTNLYGTLQDFSVWSDR